MRESLLRRGASGAHAEQEALLMANKALSLDEWLTAHPQLKERVEALLAIVEDPNADVQQADEAERWVIAEVRRLGNEALCSWAARQEGVQRTAVNDQGGAREHQGVGEVETTLAQKTEICRVFDRSGIGRLPGFLMLSILWLCSNNGSR